jgi:predicted secreted protein
MKAPLIAVTCILLGAAACTAPQGKKLSANGKGLAPVAAGPTGPITQASTLTSSQTGETVSMPRDGTVTITLDSAQRDGYMWRLSEVPDPTVLKLVSQNFTPPATSEGHGQETWIFKATGPGDVDVKMWYGNLRTAPLTGNPTFDFVASVADQLIPQKTDKKAKKTTKKSVADL